MASPIFPSGALRMACNTARDWSLRRAAPGGVFGAGTIFFTSPPFPRKAIIRFRLSQMPAKHSLHSLAQISTNMPSFRGAASNSPFEHANPKRASGCHNGGRPAKELVIQGIRHAHACCRNPIGTCGGQAGLFGSLGKIPARAYQICVTYALRVTPEKSFYAHV